MYVHITSCDIQHHVIYIFISMHKSCTILFEDIIDLNIMCIHTYIIIVNGEISAPKDQLKFCAGKCIGIF